MTHRFTHVFSARVRTRLLALIALTAFIATCLFPMRPAAAVDDWTAPSTPTTPQWSDSYGLVSETLSHGTTITASWVASTDNTGGSGIAQYRIQVSEDPNFGWAMLDRNTGSTATTYTLTASDGIAVGHAYYFRVSAIDVNGNQSSMSVASNRVDIGDQSTGPEIAHQPVVTAYYGRPIPITATATCEGDGPCSARLFFRTSGSASIPEGSWQRVDMSRGATLPRINNTDAFDYTATIPGWAVTTAGLDYYLEAEDSYTYGWFPGYSSLDAGVVPGRKGGHAWLHVQTITPPLLTHQPTIFAQADRSIPLSLDAVCSTNNCKARLYYRTTTGPATTEPLLTMPNWPSVAMSEQSSVALPDAGRRITYTASIPASYVDTRGVDYFFHVTDGHVEAFWPGTTHEAYYVPTDGQRVAWHHVHVLEPPRIVHAPVLESPYRQPIAITAESNCPTTRTCTAQLYYRTTTSGVLDSAAAFQTAPMSVTVLATHDGNNAIQINGTIPKAFADTRGVDYFFSIHDGTTTSWYPGTSHVDGYQPVDGTRVGYQHTRILEPPHIFPVAVPAAPALQDLVIEAAVTCATGDCKVSLHHTSKLTEEVLVANDAIFKTRTMTDTGISAATPAGQATIYRATIPAAEVTTRGIAYFIQARDGFTKAFSPGTFYSGAYVVTDGTRFGCAAVNAGPAPTGSGDGELYIGLDGKLSGCATQLGAHIVRVIEPPHIAHVPIVVADAGTPQTINALSNCSTPACTATLHWRITSGDWKQQTMSTTRQGVGVLGIATVDSHTLTIPAVDVKPDGLQYWIEVADGYVSDSTITYAPVVRGAGDVANYPPGIPDYPQPEDRAVRTVPPTELSARYVDPESMPGTIQFELLGPTGALRYSGTSTQVPSTGRGTVTIPALENGAYRWRARAIDSLGVASPWSSYWTLAIFDDDECGRFVGLWAPRVEDEAFVDALRAVEGYPADILAEGFHAFDEPARRMLIDCLFNQLALADPFPPETTPEQIAWIKDMLFKLIFDKTSLAKEVIEDTTAPLDQPVQTLSGTAQQTLQDIQSVTLPEVPGAITPDLPTPVPNPQDLIPEALLDEGDFPATLVLPEAQSTVDQIDDAVAILPELRSKAEKIINDERIPTPIIDPFKEVVTTAIQLTTYRACYESPTKSPTCTGLIPLGTPVPADVTGDGTLDVMMQLTPTADPAYPLGVSVKLSARRLITSEKASGSLKAHVWFIYDVATADKRLRLGFDGWRRGTSLTDLTELTYTVKEPLALTDGNLISHYSLTHSTQPATWAMTMGWSSIVPPDQEADPLVASVQFSPVPASFSGDFEIKRGVIPGGESRDIKVTGNSSVATKIDAFIVNTTTTRTPVRQDARHLVINQLPTSASLSIHQDDDATHQKTTVVTDNSAPIGVVQLTSVGWADTSKPANYRILVGELINVPAHIEMVLDQRAAEMDFTYNASSVMTQVTAAELAVADNVLSRAAVVQADQIPSSIHVNAGGDPSTGVRMTYTANSNMAKLLALYYDARSNGTVFIGEAQSIPTQVTATATIADRKLALNCNGPIGVIDVKASRGGAGVLVLGGDHATVVSVDNTIGASARISGVTEASLTLNTKLEAHLKLTPGGQPFTGAVYMNNRELGVFQVSNLPSVIDVTALANTTAPQLTYRASAVVNKVDFYYVDLVDGPTFAAGLTGVPASVDLSASMSDPATVTYNASSSLTELLVLATPVATLRINTATMPYVFGLVQGVPTSITATMDIDTGNYYWNASAPVSLVAVGAKGIAPAPANASALVAAVSVPAQFEGHVNPATRSVSWQGTSGPIGLLLAQVTNYGRVNTFGGPHIHAYFNATNGQWDASAVITNIWAASASFGADLKSIKASLSADLQGRLFYVDGTYIHDTNIRLDVVGVVANFPSWIEVTANENSFTYKSNANVHALFFAQAGWTQALNSFLYPPLIDGISVADGSCGAAQGCGAPTTELCSNGKCLGFKAAIYANGLPTTATVNWRDNYASVTNYRPTTGLFRIWASIRHTLPVPVFAFVSQEGIPAGVNINVTGLHFVSRKGARPMDVGFHMTATQPLGRLWGVGTAYGVFNGQDVTAAFELGNVGNQLGLNVSMGGKTEIHGSTSTASPTYLFVQGRTTVSGGYVYAEAMLNQIPSTFDMVVERVPAGEGLKIPKMTYNASSSGMDGYLFADGRMTADVASFTTEAQARVLAGFTDLGRTVTATVNLADKSLFIDSRPVATGELYLWGSFLASTERKVWGDSDSYSVGSLRVSYTLEAALDIGESGIESVLFYASNISTVSIRTKVPISFSISGTYGWMGVFIQGVKFNLEELSVRLKLQLDWKGAKWIKFDEKISFSHQFRFSFEAHVLRNVERGEPLLRWDPWGPLCYEVKAKPSYFKSYVMGNDPNHLTGFALFGSDGAQEVWFEPYDLLSDWWESVGDLVVAKWFTSFTDNGFRVAGC